MKVLVSWRNTAVRPMNVHVEQTPIGTSGVLESLNGRAIES